MLQFSCTAECLLLGPQAAQGTEEGSTRSHSLTHRFVLEAAEVAETPRTTVAMQLLGPHTVRSADGLSTDAIDLTDSVSERQTGVPEHAAHCDPRLHGHPLSCTSGFVDRFATRRAFDCNR